MDHTDRIHGLRRDARLHRGRPGRRTAARLTRTLLALAAFVLVIVPGAPAWAHNALAEAKPAKNATLKESPEQVKLRFLQKLNPDRTTITVSDAGKEKVGTSDPKVDGATGTVTIDEPLANGVYTVAYEVSSTDGHTVKGSYQFTVEAPQAAASTAPSASASPSLAPTLAPTVNATTVADKSTDSDETSIVGIVAGVVVAVAAVAGFLFIRRRKA